MGSKDVLMDNLDGHIPRILKRGCVSALGKSSVRVHFLTDHVARLYLSRLYLSRLHDSDCCMCVEVHVGRSLLSAKSAV